MVAAKVHSRADASGSSMEGPSPAHGTWWRPQATALTVHTGRGSGQMLAPWLSISERKGARLSRLLARSDFPVDTSSGSPLDKGCEADLSPTPTKMKGQEIAFRPSPRPSYGKVFQSLMN